jgi:hypothetical protein
MPTLFVIVPTFGKRPVPYDFTVMDAIVAELDGASPGAGAYTGAGGTEGYLAFGYRMTDEAATREALARAMNKHLPRTPYDVRVAEDSGCNIAFEVLKEFTPKKLSLRHPDGRPLGTFEQVQAVIRRLFPAVQFGWTPDGPERVRMCEEGGHPLPPEHRQRLEGVPSELEGVAEGPDYRVTFGLGSREPVGYLRVTPLGGGAELQAGIAGLESDVGAKFQVSEGEGSAEPGT